MKDNSVRGTIHYKARKQQIVNYRNLRIGTITPTDIDGYIELASKATVLIELKLKDTPIKDGQRRAFEKLVDDIQAGNKQAVLFLCEHSVYNVTKEIDASKAIVRGFYYNHRWYPGQGYTLGEKIDSFLRFIGYSKERVHNGKCREEERGKAYKEE